MSVNEIISELYSDARIDRCIRNFAAIHPEDIKQDLFCVLLAKEKSLIQKLHKEGSLYYYAVVVIQNLTRTEKRRARVEELTEEVSEREEPEWDTERFISAFNSMGEEMGTFYYPELIRAIVKNGTQAKVSELTGIPKRTICRSVEQVRQHLRQKICY